MQTREGLMERNSDLVDDAQLERHLRKLKLARPTTKHRIAPDDGPEFSNESLSAARGALYAAVLGLGISTALFLLFVYL